MTNQEIEKEDEQVYSFLCFLTLAPLILTKGATFHLLYKWFVLPMSNYSLSYWHFIGLVILIDTLNASLRRLSPDEPAKEVLKQCWNRIAEYGAAILLGWLAKLMM